MLGKPRILSLFLNSFNKFNSTHVRSSMFISALFLLILLVLCSIAVVNVVIAVKIFYFETTPPSWLQVGLFY